MCASAYIFCVQYFPLNTKFWCCITLSNAINTNLCTNVRQINIYWNESKTHWENDWLSSTMHTVCCTVHIYYKAMLMFHNILHKTHIKISKAMDTQCQQANHQTNGPAKIEITTNQANSEQDSVYGWFNVQQRWEEEKKKPWHKKLRLASNYFKYWFAWFNNHH